MRLIARTGLWLFIGAFLCLGYGTAVDAAESAGAGKMGVIVLSHGAPVKIWNDTVAKIVALAKAPYPIETAFFDYDEERTLEKSIRRLEEKGAEEILVIHLTPSSYSMHHEEARYMVGLRKDLGFYTEFLDPPIKSKAKKIAVSPGMDEHPIVTEILTEFARKLSQDPENESLVLIGHGPVEELSNIMWERQLNNIGRQIQESLKFREVAYMTLRNDSADLIREKVAEDLKNLVKRLSSQGKVLVVFNVLGVMMVQMEVKRILKGITPVVMSNKGLASHPKTVKWIEDTISRGMNQTEPPPVKRTWSHLDYETGKPVGTLRYGTH